MELLLRDDKPLAMSFSESMFYLINFTIVLNLVKQNIFLRWSNF